MNTTVQIDTEIAKSTSPALLAQDHHSDNIGEMAAISVGSVIVISLFTVIITKILCNNRRKERQTPWHTGLKFQVPK